MGWFSRKAPVVHDLNAVDVARGLTEGRILLVDVREPNEVAVEAYPDAFVLPMSAFDAMQTPAGGKEITAMFDGGQLSSDGGVLILREIEKRLGIATMLSRHMPDARDPGRIVHTHAT